MKVLTVILLLVLMIGVTPAFAASSPADEQTVDSTAVKGASNDIKNVSSENSGYIDGYDDNGNYIGYYIVVDPSDTSNLSDETADNNDQSGNNVDDSNVLENGIDELNDDENGDYTVIGVYNEFEYTFELSDENNGTDELDEDDYIVIDSSNQSFENETISQIDENVPTSTGGHLLVNLVDELCGVVQSILGGLDTI